MASVASQLIQEVTAHAQSDSLEDAREICADGTYFMNNLRICSWADKFCLKCNIFTYVIHIWIKPVLCSRMVSLFHHTSP